MLGSKKLAHHSDLMTRMADTVGADLADAMAEGRIDAEMLRAATISCAGCDDATECPSWLDDHATGAEAPPGYCRNRNLMLALQG